MSTFTQLIIDQHSVLTSALTLLSFYTIIYEERVTLDLDLHFCSDRQNVSLPNIAIAEVKQAGLNRSSLFMRQMRMMNWRRKIRN